MSALVLKLTDAGLAAVQAPAGSDPTIIASLGLTNTLFDYAPTLTGLPGEFKRLDVASGIAAAANVTHLTAYDTSADVWTATGLGLFLDDGTLFAVHNGAEPIMSKVGLAFALLAFDISFETDFAAQIAYGNAVFAYPRATESIAGIAELATPGEALAGTDAGRMITPATLRHVVTQALNGEGSAGPGAAVWHAGNDGAGSGLDADLLDGHHAQHFLDGIAGARDAIGQEANARSAADGGLQDAINQEAGARAGADNNLQGQVDALAGRTVTGGGLVSGGGQISSSPTLTVTEASDQDITDGTVADKVVTPRRLGPITMLIAQAGFIRFFGLQLAWGRFNANANGITTVNFARSFPNACFSVVVSGVTAGGNDSQENPPAVIANSITKDGFPVFSADNSASPCCYFAVGY